MDFEIVGPIRDKEVIARGGSVKALQRLERAYGKGDWRKLKGFAMVRMADGSTRVAEIHWFEAHGIGRKEFKIK